VTNLLKRFATYYRLHRWLFALDFSSAVVAGLPELAFPIAVTLFIDRLVPTGQIGMIVVASLCFFDHQKTGHILVGVFFRPIDKIKSIIETYPKGIADLQRYTIFVDTRPVIADRPDALKIGLL